MKRYRKYIAAIAIILIIFFTLCFIPIGATKFVPIVEKQAEQELGVKIHIEKLILRIGPSLKIKTPVMHIMYADGQKFGQLDNVKFYIPWSALFNNDVSLKKIYADGLIIKTSSDDKYLPELLARLDKKDTDECQNIILKNYSVAYKDSSLGKDYKLSGKNFAMTKVFGSNNPKISTDGDFFINDKHYINYNISVQSEKNLFINDKYNINELVEQVEALDFHSDVLANLKISQNNDKNLIITGLSNIDNISVLDKDKKNPKSFIYLTFMGDKIGILSNIYASATEKIYAEGLLNTSKKPELDLRVKTDEINLSDAYKKIKLLVDCSRFKGIDSIDGKLKADFNIKGDLNKIRSQGFLKITNGAIKSNGINIDNINSDIDFSNNVIKISDTKGYVNNAPIEMSGEIDKNINLDILMSKVPVKHLFPEKYGINSGILTLTAKISGTLDNVIHKENIRMDNFKLSNNKTTVSFDSLKIDTNKENTAYVSNILIKPDKTEIIKIPLLKLFVEKNSIRTPDTNIFMPNSKIQARGEISDYSSANYAFSLNAKGFINAKDLSGFTKNSIIYPIKFSMNGNKDIKNIDAYIHMQKPMILDEPSLLTLSSKIENNNLKIEELNISPYNEDLLNAQKINLKAAKKLLISGSIENLKQPILKNIRIIIPQSLNVMFFDSVAQIKGDVFLNGEIRKPDIIGQISIQNLVNQFIQLNLNNMSIDFDKNIATINAPVIKLSDSSFGINAIISNDFTDSLNIKNINIKSKFINTDSLLMYKDSPLFKACQFNVNEGKLYSERALMTVYGAPLYMSALTANFKINNNIINVKDLSSELFNGKMSSNFNFNLTDESFDANIQARLVSAAPIFDIISSKKESVSGIMDFDSSIKGNLMSKDSLNGSVKFEVRNGHMGTLGKLEHLLYAQNVISDNMLRTSLSVITKAITLKDTGLFKFLRGDITLNNGIATVNMLQSKGPLMSLFIKGQYNPVNDYGRLVVLGRISDDIISSLGTFGEFSFNKLMIMLTGEDTKYNINVEDIEKLPQLPAKNTKEFRTIINGTLEKPSSVIMFNWISYTQKSLKQKEVPMSNEKLPDFVENIPY